MHRRELLKALPLLSVVAPALADDDESADRELRLAQIAARPILTIPELTHPVKITALDLLSNGKTFITRVRSQDGAEGYSIANDSRLRELFPVFLRRVAPFFINKDARELEALLTQLYRQGSNYKLQGIALWACQATAEMAILDMLGKLSGRSLGNMLGGVKRDRIAVYRASGNRGNSVEAEIDYLHKLSEETGGKALKFRLGGRMSNNKDSLPGRSEKLIQRAREEFGPRYTLYADSNSSYDVQNAIRIGRIMEEYEYGFFEEPCPFDHLWETQKVADVLDIPVAGGEQEFSMRRFRWAIANRVMDVIQPDLHYFGGYIRVLKVARMANSLDLPCTVHMSGSGLGYVDVCHLASCIENPGPHQEFKGATNLPIHCSSSSLRCERGFVQVPKGPGYGSEIDPDFINKAELVTV